MGKHGKATASSGSTKPKEPALTGGIKQFFPRSQEPAEQQVENNMADAPIESLDNCATPDDASEVEEWSSWDDDAPTSVKIEGGNGTLSTQSSVEQDEPDYFKDMTPTIRKTHKIVIKKREPASFGNMDFSDGSIGFSSRLAATQDIPFIHQSAELGDLETWQENSNAWEEEGDASWQAEEVLRQQKMAEREKRMAEQQRKKMEKEVQRLMKKDQIKMGVKLS